jgi:hypothetical protein
MIVDRTFDWGFSMMDGTGALTATNSSTSNRRWGRSWIKRLHCRTLRMHKDISRDLLGKNISVPAAITKWSKNKKTYNSGYSPVVTHLTTNPPVHCLSTAERTGSSIFSVLWSYVEIFSLLNSNIVGKIGCLKSR